MKFWRAQKQPAKDGTDFNWFNNGAVGDGIYAMPAGANNMRKYYTQNGEKIYEFEIEDRYVKEVKGLGLATYWAIRERIYALREEGYKAFIVKHKGIGIPTGKQILIVDPEIIKNIAEL